MSASQPRESARDAWTSARDYEARLALIVAHLRTYGFNGVRESVVREHFGADRHEMVAKLRALRSRGIVSYEWEGGIGLWWLQ